ncbi:hypothetical protein D9M68_916090 [compost metagenome]
MAALVVFQLEVVEGPATDEYAILILEAQVQFGHHLDHLGEQVALLEVEVAVIRVDQPGVAARTAIGPGDQLAVLAFHAVADAIGKRGVERGGPVARTHLKRLRCAQR